MSKYLTVFSDSHGERQNLSRLIGDFSVSDKIVFLGDGLGDLIELFDFEDKIIKVAGNCDFISMESKQKIFTLEGVTFLAVHGDMFSVKSGYSRLIKYAKSVGARVVLCGHTHIPIVKEEDGVLIVNPGTMSRHGSQRTFAFISVNDGKISAKLIPFNSRI